MLDDEEDESPPTYTPGLLKYMPSNFTEEEIAIRYNHNMAERRNRRREESEMSTIDKIGGLGEIMTVVWNTIRFPLDKPEACRHMKTTRGLILHGPNGVGKTMLMQALKEGCSRCNPKMVPFVLSPRRYFVDDVENKLVQLFNKAKEESRPSIIFLDNVDFLVSPDRPHVRTLGALMDSLDDSGSVFVVAATDRLDRVDPEMRKLGRFDTDLCIELPNLEARKDILSKMTRKWGLEPSIINTAAKGTPDFTGADLGGLCQTAMKNALFRTYPNYKRYEPIDWHSIHAEMEDFKQALRTELSTKQMMEENLRGAGGSSD